MSPDLSFQCHLLSHLLPFGVCYHLSLAEVASAQRGKQRVPPSFNAEEVQGVPATGSPLSVLTSDPALSSLCSLSLPGSPSLACLPQLCTDTGTLLFTLHSPHLSLTHSLQGPPSAAPHSSQTSGVTDSHCWSFNPGLQNPGLQILASASTQTPVFCSSELALTLHRLCPYDGDPLCP